MKNKYLVSIIMNCYNGDRYLEESVKSILNQSYKNWELIFWDNQSIDNSAKILKKFDDKRIKYYKAKFFKKLGESRASAYEKCRGEFIAFLDTDDIWFKKKLEYQIKHFNDPDVGIVICNTNFFNNKYKKILYKQPPKQGYVLKNLISNYNISLETLILKQSYLKKLDHVFDKNYTHISDLDLILRLAKHCKLSYENRVLAGWRVHSQSETWKYPEKFITEKKLFIKKIQNRYKSFFNEYKKEWKAFIVDTDLKESVNLLAKNKIRECREYNLKKVFYNYKYLIIFLFTFFPKINFFILLALSKRKKVLPG